MVKGSGSWGLRPGTHFQSGDSAFHRWTCASTIMRRSAWADASCGPCAARTAPAPRVPVTKLRRVGMDRSSLKPDAAAFIGRRRLAGRLCDFPRCEGRACSSPRSARCIRPENARRPIGPGRKLLRIGVVRADPNDGAKRRHPRRDALVESEYPAVIAVAFDGDLERG